MSTRFSIFEGLSEKEISYFLLMSDVTKFKKNEKIVIQGDATCRSAYLIKSGTADVLIDGRKVATLKEGDIFGEIALITSEPRTATVIANDNVEAYAFQKEDFFMLFKKSDRFDELKQLILKRIIDNFYGAGVHS